MYTKVVVLLFLALIISSLFYDVVLCAFIPLQTPQRDLGMVFFFACVLPCKYNLLVYLCDDVIFCDLLTCFSSHI